MSANRNEKLVREYRTLDTVIIEDCQTNVAKANAGKNRYNNIQPYDKNRVVLSNATTDFINASFIRVGFTFNPWDL